MNFSPETIIGLKRLCNSSLMNENSFNELVVSCVQAVKSNEIVNKSIPQDIKVDVMKAAYAALTVIYIEAVRHGVDDEMLKHILEGFYLNEDRISFIIKGYNSCKQNVKLKLMQIGTSLPHIIDIHWRLDYCVKANCTKQLLKPYFQIELKAVTSENREKVIRFICSQQNLEELVYSLKSATRHISKFMSGSLK